MVRFFGNVVSGEYTLAVVLALAGLFCVSLSSAAFAKSDHWTGCHSDDPDVRIVGCTRIIALGSQETKRKQITAYINRSGAYRAKGDLDRAIADLDKALQLDPKSATALTERASIYHAKGDLNRAIADFDAAIAARPHSAAVFYGRGEVYRAKNDLDRAIADYNRVVQLDRNLAMVYRSRAEAYRGKGDLDKALADFNAALKFDPKSALLYVDRGVIYQIKGDFNQAIADYDEAIKRDPELAIAYNNRGLAFLAKGDFDRALVDFSAAIQFDPKYAEAFLNRANVYRGKLDLEHAGQDLEAALRLDPRLASGKETLDEMNRLAKNAAPATAAAPTPPSAPVAKASSERLAQRSPLASSILFHLGPVPITRPVVTTWAILLVLSTGSWLVTRQLRLRPDRRQGVLELVVTGIIGADRGCHSQRPAAIFADARHPLHFSRHGQSLRRAAGRRGADEQARDAGRLGDHRVFLGAFFRNAGAGPSSAISRASPNRS